MSSANTRMARRRRSHGMDRITTIVLVAFILVASTTVVLALMWARGITTSRAASNSSTGGSVVSGNPSSGSILTRNTGNVAAPKGPLQRNTGPTPVAWDGASRVTVLLMGVDYRDWEAGTDVPRTDMMILLSLDPATKTAGMLSIPRDMWVDIPGMGYNKINTAYRWGEIYEVPGGGPALAMKTVQQFIGMPVNYYALINFDAFAKFIDELGGLDMKIREEIEIDPIGPGNTKILEPGTQTLTGAEALAYARQRHTAGNDFDRSSRQQEVIMAIRKQILQFNMLPTLVSKAPVLYQEIASGISTNLTLDQVIRLSLLASQVNEKSIRKGVIAPPSQVDLGKSPDGQDIVIPINDQIRILRDEVFGTSGATAVISNQPTAAPTIEESGDPAELMKAEKARVVIKNGTTTVGLASKASEMLKGLGVNIISLENADQSASMTTIKDFTGKPHTTKFLAKALSVSTSRVFNSYDPNAQADVEIILGADWAVQQK